MPKYGCEIKLCNHSSGSSVVGCGGGGSDGDGDGCCWHGYHQGNTPTKWEQYLSHGWISFFIWTSGMGDNSRVDDAVGWHMGLIKTAHAFVND